MPVSSRLVLTLKAARQLGARQAAWFALYQAGLKSGLWRALTPPGEYRPLETEVRPVFHLPPPDRLAQVVGAGAETLLAEADAIAAGRFRPYGGERAELRLAPAGPLLHWTEAEQRILPGEDIKDTWEPARFGWAFTLGRAYRLGGDERYPAAFWQHCEIFLQANPPNLGPNWISAQEVALRLAALLFAWQVFAASPHSTPARQAVLAGALAAHAQRIPPTLSYAHAQHNNHLLSEGLGLLLAGCALPRLPQAPQWIKMGLRALEDGFARQISPQGVYAQHSLNYHRVMLHIALLADSLQPAGDENRLAGRPGALPGRIFSPDVRARLAEAARWLWAQVDPTSGQAPNYGHNDGAYLLPLSGGGESAYSDQRPTVQAAARAFLGRAVLAGGPWDETGLWLGESLEERPAAPPAPSHPAVLHLGDSTSWAVLRAGRYTSRPAHADQLHVDLWWQGEPVALDAGTYRYNAAPPWENGLAATAVHNTITVDGQSQMRRAGRFLWLDWAQAQVLTGNATRQAAEHDGYRRLGVRHRRTLERVSAEHWRVEDELSQAGETTAAHTFCLHWLLPDAPYRLEGSALQLELPAGRVQLRVTPGQPAGLSPSLSLVRAGQCLTGAEEASPLLGWYSPTYGVKHPALSLVFTVQSSLPLVLVSEFHFDAR